jgi:hypothetical protein
MKMRVLAPRCSRKKELSVFVYAQENQQYIRRSSYYCASRGRRRGWLFRDLSIFVHCWKSEISVKARACLGLVLSSYGKASPLTSPVDFSLEWPANAIGSPQANERRTIHLRWPPAGIRPETRDLNENGKNSTCYSGDGRSVLNA